MGVFTSADGVAVWLWDYVGAIVLIMFGVGAHVGAFGFAYW